MSLQPLLHWLLAVAVVSQAAAGPAFAPPTPAAAPATEAAPDLIATRHPQFTIPFRVERSEDPAWQPVEARLFVSTDRGAHWALYARAPTAKQEFTFRSGGDGEYWFAIRTADRSGRVRPETIVSPGLRVLVDTKPPVLKITARAIEDGQVLVHWQIDEPHLKPDSLKIVYRPSAVEPWLAVAIEPRTIDAAAVSQNGEVIFRAKPGSRDIQIRVEVSDTAGNSASDQARVTLDRAAGPVAPADPNGSVAIAIHPAIGNRYDGSGGSSERTPTLPGMPPGERPRMVNSRTFELAYDVDSVGPSGIGRVELWGTRDGGQSWRRFTVESGKRSSLVVKVDEEGLYGFRAVVTNGAGLGGKPPKSGDAPDIWIGVDLTKPTARIVSAQTGRQFRGRTGDYLVAGRRSDVGRPTDLASVQHQPWRAVDADRQRNGEHRPLRLVS